MQEGKFAPWGHLAIAGDFWGERESERSLAVEHLRIMNSAASRFPMCDTQGHRGLQNAGDWSVLPRLRNLDQSKTFIRCVVTGFPDAVTGFPDALAGKESACNARDCPWCRRPRFNPWVRKIPWRREQQPSPGSFSGSHGQRSLVGYSPWGRRESEMTTAKPPIIHHHILSTMLQ